MNYEKGLIHLRKQLIRANDTQAMRHLTNLQAHLDAIKRSHSSETDEPSLTQETERVINRLNQISYRTTGTSFANLCRDRPRVFSKTLPSLSLRGLLLLILAALFLPGLGIVLASSMIEINRQWQVDQTREEIQAIDALIGSNVMSFFYLSQVDPCSDSILQEVTTIDGLEIRITTASGDSVQSIYQTPILCVWEYQDADSGEVIAKDFWKDNFRLEAREGDRLKAREYYKNRVNIARDSFDWQNNDCFKRRSYLDDQSHLFYEECYSEAGSLRTIKPDDVFSPIPPMVYWFFYR